MPRRFEAPPLVAHVVDYFEAGGLENGVTNLLNEAPPNAFRHAVICVKEFTSFRTRIVRQDVPFYALEKQPGADVTWYGRLWRVLRTLRPAIVHTRNLGALEAQAVAAAAGVTARVHSEHGRDIWDLQGTRRKYNLLRRVLHPCVHRYVAVSDELAHWLTSTVRVPCDRITRIYNGVDTSRFRRAPGVPPPADTPHEPGTFVIGTVGRMAAVKDQRTLVEAFVHLLRTDPALRSRLRLTVVGDGPLRAQCMALAEAAGVIDLCWIPGKRNDVADILRTFHLFVLPSIAEGTSNTILEAMATELPVIATAVGGNPELVAHGTTGTLVGASDPVALAHAIRTYLTHPSLLQQHGHAGRRRVEAEFGLRTMVDAYLGVYDDVLSTRSSRRERRAHGRGPVEAA